MPPELVLLVACRKEGAERGGMEESIEELLKVQLHLSSLDLVCLGMCVLSEYISS